MLFLRHEKTNHGKFLSTIWKNTINTLRKKYNVNKSTKSMHYCKNIYECTVCSYPFYVASYYKKWVTTSQTYSINCD